MMDHFNRILNFSLKPNLNQKKSGFKKCLDCSRSKAEVSFHYVSYVLSSSFRENDWLLIEFKPEFRRHFRLINRIRLAVERQNDPMSSVSPGKSGKCVLSSTPILACL